MNFVINSIHQMDTATLARIAILLPIKEYAVHRGKFIETISAKMN
jgi:hypothetical protein